MRNYKRYIGISIGTTFVSRSIQFFRKDIVYSDTKMIPTHVFIFYGEILGEGLMGESTDPVIRLAPLDKYVHKNKNKRIEIYELPDYISDEKIEQSLKELLPYVGKWYAFTQLLGYVWIWLGHQFGKQWHNLVKNNPDEATCSDFGFQHLQKSGYQDPELMSMEVNDVAPDNILKSVKKNCKLVGLSDFQQEDITWYI
jgi:hypothetical protein